MKSYALLSQLLATRKRLQEIEYSVRQSSKTRDVSFVENENELDILNQKFLKESSLLQLAKSNHSKSLSIQRVVESEYEELQSERTIARQVAEATTGRKAIIIAEQSRLMNVELPAVLQRIIVSQVLSYGG